MALGGIAPAIPLPDLQDGGVNGRLIGRGELAAVGDELVVVVTDTSRIPHI